MKRVIISIAAVLCLLVGTVLLRTVTYGHKQNKLDYDGPVLRVDGAAASERLSKAIQIRTVSDGTGAGEILLFHDFLRAAFPRVHALLTREIINGRSLLYTWQGEDPGLNPALLMAHLDVVPIDPNSEGKWTHPPFAGRIADGFVWGRGAMDNKAGVLGILEAVEQLLADGFQPRRTVYLAFGHDEETGGAQGAAKIAELLESRKVALEFVLDEGGNITDGIVPGIERPVALIGIAEKGYLSLDLTVEATGGHSSMPPARTAIGILAAALYKLETAPFPTRLAQPTRTFFEFIGSEMKWPERMAIANLWLFESLVRKTLADSPLTSALIRTTQAATIFRAGVQENVLPTRARAVINFRILTGDTVAGVTSRVSDVIGDSRVKITPLNPQVEPSAVADVESKGFHALALVVRASAPDAIVAPFLLVAATDSRHYAALTKNIFRFLPIRLKPEDTKRYHGIDERISIEDYVRCVRFYASLIRGANVAG